jgi:outer membrane protein OmpA-like peptidoglycan-associated protein
VAPEGQANGWSTNDDADSGWKIYGGYQFKPLWSVELSYVNGGEAGLGNVNPALELLIPDATIDYTTPSIMAVRWLKERNEPFNAFLKLGVSAIGNSASDSRIPYEKQTSAQLAAGLGAQLKFAERWFVRGDVDFYDRDHYYAGLSIGGNFGGAGASIPAPTPYEPPPAVEKPPVVEKAPVVAPAPVPAPAPAPVCNDVVTVLDGVTFDTNSDRLTLNARRVLDNVVDRLKASPSDTVEVLAHTDSQGSAEYNMGLSIRRAKSVDDYLVAQGIAGSRVSYRGVGEAQPIADNDTAAGRALNRRVELVWSEERCN